MQADVGRVGFSVRVCEAMNRVRDKNEEKERKEGSRNIDTVFMLVLRVNIPSIVPNETGRFEGRFRIA